MRRTNRRTSGFTLIELLIAIALMVMLLAAVTMIFAGTTDTVATQEARMTVFTNARYAVDIMENDLLGCLSFDPLEAQKPGPAGAAPPPPPTGAQVPLQRFWMENGWASTADAFPQKVGGHHTDAAGDTICFRSTTTVGDSMQTCEVTYSLIPGSKAIGPSNTVVSGDMSHQATLRTGRALFTLVRKVRVAEDPGAGGAGGAGGAVSVDPKVPWKFTAKVKDRVSGAMIDVMDQEICHYIVSFNLEYYAANQQFSQLDPSPFNESNPAGQEPTGSAVIYRVPAVRVTLVIVDDVGERQERTIQKAIWIPQG